MRTFLDSDATHRSVLLAAVRSPAVFQNLKSQNFPTQCVWGCGQLGTWNHCAWFCPNRLSDLTPPLNPVARRFGWFQRNDDMNIAVWCAKVAQQIRECSTKVPVTTY